MMVTGPFLEASSWLVAAPREAGGQAHPIFLQDQGINSCKFDEITMLSGVRDLCIDALHFFILHHAFTTSISLNFDLFRKRFRNTAHLDDLWQTVQPGPISEKQVQCFICSCTQQLLG